MAARRSVFIGLLVCLAVIAGTVGAAPATAEVSSLADVRINDGNTLRPSRTNVLGPLELMGSAAMGLGVAVQDRSSGEWLDLGGQTCVGCTLSGDFGRKWVFNSVVVDSAGGFDVAIDLAPGEYQVGLRGVDSNGKRLDGFWSRIRVVPPEGTIDGPTEGERTGDLLFTGVFGADFGIISGGRHWTAEVGDVFLDLERTDRPGRFQDRVFRLSVFRDRSYRVRVHTVAPPGYYRYRIVNRDKSFATDWVSFVVSRGCLPECERPITLDGFDMRVGEPYYFEPYYLLPDGQEQPPPVYGAGVEISGYSDASLRGGSLRIAIYREDDDTWMQETADDAGVWDFTYQPTFGKSWKQHSSFFTGVAYSHDERYFLPSGTYWYGIRTKDENGVEGESIWRKFVIPADPRAGG